MTFGKEKFGLIIAVLPLLLAAIVMAGPYNEAGINGYIGPNHRGIDPCNPSAMVNPLFCGWASGIAAYQPVPNSVDFDWSDPNNALGPATGDVMSIVSLGELSLQQINEHDAPGSITLTFNQPIRNGNGYDLAVFENGFKANIDADGGAVSGQMFAEFAYVEVSTDGIHFARFPSVSLTPRPTFGWAYLTIDISNVYNLAGKHPNAGGVCTGTPFDLDDLANDPNVIAGFIDLNNIHYVRIVDIPGSGDFVDKAESFILPDSWPNWPLYPQRHGIYDPWPTYGSAGFDLDAVGVLCEQQYSADINLDGIVDMADFALFANAWGSHFGQSNFMARCDVALPHDHVVDYRDMAVFSQQWLGVEQWRKP